MLPELNKTNVEKFNIHGGQLIVVAGRPSMGKTLFMLNQIRLKNSDFKLRVQ